MFEMGKLVARGSAFNFSQNDMQKIFKIKAVVDEKKMHWDRQLSLNW